MTKCHFCQQENPADAQRCAKCGAWITQGFDPEARRDAMRDAGREEPAPLLAADATGPEPGSLEGQVLALMEASKKITAIKLYREATGVGLAEAKQAVEELAARHGIQSKVAGCGTAVLLLGVGWVLLRGFVW